MSSENTINASLIAGFGALDLTEPNAENVQNMPNLSCRLPQTSGETDYAAASHMEQLSCSLNLLVENSDIDADNDNIIIDTSSVVSYFHASCAGSASSSLSDLLAEPPDAAGYSGNCVFDSTSPVLNSENTCSSDLTIPDTDDCEGTTASSMNNTPMKRASDGDDKQSKRLRRTSFKRKYESSSARSEDDSDVSVQELKFRSGISKPKLVSSPKLNLKLVTTRSGRTVRTRVDNKYDYSSEHHEQDDEYEDDDNNDYDEHDDDDNDEDYSVNEDFCENEPKWSKRKQRRVSSRHSYTSSDNGSLTECDACIYLDLSKPTAIVLFKPPPEDATADSGNDSELGTSLQKCLGLVPSMRRLYNPMQNYEMEEMQTDDEPRNRSTASIDTMPAPPTLLSTSILPSPSSAPICSPSFKKMRQTLKPTAKELEAKFINDLVLNANANCFVTQTPDHIKEAIDLSGMPDAQQRKQNCRKHTYIYGCLEKHPWYYSFVESLSTETTINLCHPSALKYKQRQVDTCKEALANVLFDLFNHKIFHCGLKRQLVWKRSIYTPSSCEYIIEAGGQRTARILLWKHIKDVSMLIKALLHEMCHAAAFVYHGETGHGDWCRKWAYQAKKEMHELPTIDDCAPSFTYSCCLCRARSYGRMKFENEAEQLRCYRCQFELIVEPHSTNDVHHFSYTYQSPTPYKAFIKQHYMQMTQASHTAKMKALNTMYLQSKPHN